MDNSGDHISRKEILYDAGIIRLQFSTPEH